MTLPLFGKDSAGYHRERTELLPKDDEGSVRAKSTTVAIDVKFPPGTPEGEIVARMLGELREAECDLVEWQRERRKPNGKAK